MTERKEKTEKGALKAAIDMSSDELRFVVASSDGTVELEEGRAARGRECATLVSWLRERLDSIGATFGDVDEWTLGTGPGSFTGLRMAAATVLGITFGASAKRVRGASSGLALAAALDSAEGERVGAVFRGRRDDVTIVLAKKTDGVLRQVGEPRISRLDKMANAIESVDWLAALEKDRSALKNALTSDALKRIRFFESFPVQCLLFLEESGGERGELMNLNYLRPATTAPPSPPRSPLLVSTPS